jgi:UDP-N-acetylglucosamine 2-epimerase (non-hydrolysing)
MTARLADLHFAPTEQARANLSDGRNPRRRHRGDRQHGRRRADADARALEAKPALPLAVGERNRYVLVTAHRRESHGPALGRICDAIEMLLARDPQLDAWVPMHPSPNVRSVLTARLGNHPRVRLTEPLGYRAFVLALADAALILTDSGGVQEECAALGRPVLVMREDTERPEALEAGVAILVGTDTAQIVETGAGLLDDAERYRRMARPRPRSAAAVRRLRSSTRCCASNDERAASA